MERSTAKAVSVMLGISVTGLIAVWLGTASAYWSGTIASRWPLATVSLAVAGLLGIAAIAGYPFKKAASRLIGTALYLAAFGTAVFFTGLLTACRFGDCL